ncbi:hypothetical protein LCGC14_1395700 [marine sediment metagenome]|uniref:Phage-like element PBSX protein XkdF domain-containing protein n=2 Tax=root TaxID=1 RepID=A0A831QTF7_9FLAO|nr:hypothetical protein [Pricia sp.]HEA22748.1 hypothetical protein [Pricia antarctica]
MNKLDLFRLTYDPKKDKGVYGLSLVADPAMEGMFVAFGKDDKPEPFKMEFSDIDKEQRIIMGVALVPHKPIYRNQDGYEFNVYLEKSDIKSVAHNFLKSQFNNNSTIEHSKKIDGVSVVESWIVEDEANDKSNLYGLKASKGSWVTSMKIDNEEVWNEYVKTGKVLGFSIDGLFTLQKINFNKTSMADKTLAQEIKEGFAELKSLFSGKEVTPEPVKMASAKLDDGTEVQFDGESIAVDTALFTTDAEGNQVAVKDGEHKLEDGSFAVTVEGIVTELKPKEEAPAEETEMSDEDAELKELKEMLDVLRSEFATAKEGFETSLSEKDTKITELETQLSKTPATKPKKHTPAKANFSSDKPMTLAEAIRFKKQ